MGGMANIQHAVVSADDLSSYADESFDAVTMSYVLMFVPDRARCLAEVARVLKPGGTAFVSVWKELSFIKTFYYGALEEHLGQPPPAPKVNPMALSSANAVEHLVATTDALEIVLSEELSYP